MIWEVKTAMNIRITVYCNVTPCCLLYTCVSTIPSVKVNTHPANYAVSLIRSRRQAWAQTWYFLNGKSKVLLLWIQWLCGLFPSHVLIFNTLIYVRDGISACLYPCFFHNYVITIHYTRSCCQKSHIISKNAERKFSVSLFLCHQGTNRMKHSEFTPRSVRQVKLLNMVGVRLLNRKINGFRQSSLSPKCTSDFGVISYLEGKQGIFIFLLCYV